MRAMLALPLLVLGVPLADHPDHTLPPDHLAVLADRFDARAHLHGILSPTGSCRKDSQYRPPIPGPARSRCWRDAEFGGRAGAAAGGTGDRTRAQSSAARNSESAAAGSSARRIGRPTTRWVAPWRTASAGAAGRARS